jgi:hypothetical protein
MRGARGPGLARGDADALVRIRVYACVAQRVAHTRLGYKTGLGEGTETREGGEGIYSGGSGRVCAAATGLREAQRRL